MKSFTLLLIPLILLWSCTIDWNDENRKSTKVLNENHQNQTWTNTIANETNIHAMRFNGASMEPTIHDDDIVYINTSMKEFHHWDIIAFSTDHWKYIKRIIGLPWETIKFSSGLVFLKNQDSDEFAKIDEIFLSSWNINKTFLPQSETGSEFTMPLNMYWVMGDNRQNSSDSRSCFYYTCLGKDIKTHFLNAKDIYWIVIK